MPKYKVTGQHEVLGRKPGETIDKIPPEINVDALLESGAIGPDEGSSAKEPKIPCPACTDEGRKRVPKFDTHDELVAHYAEKHPALAPPEKEE